MSSVVRRDSTSSSWMASSFIHYLTKCINFVSPPGNGGRRGKLMALFLLLLYDPFFESDPQAPLFFSIAATIGYFFKLDLIAELDLIALLIGSFVLLIASIKCKNNANDRFFKCTSNPLSYRAA